MSKPQFTEQAWEEYMYWHDQDRKTLKKINRLIEDIMRNGAIKGEGKPEALKGDLQGFFSRRINHYDRLVYKVIGGDIIEIYSCMGHYEE